MTAPALPARHGLDLAGTAAAVLGAALFSSKAVMVKLAYGYGANTEALLFWRMALALPFYLGIGVWALRGRLRAKPRLADALPLKLAAAAAANGLLGYYLASLLDFLGLQFVTAQFERLILFTYPFIVVVLGAMFFKQPLKRRTFPAAALAYGGVGLIFAHSLNTQGPHVAQGTLLVLGAAFSFALFLLFGKGLVAKLGPALYTTVAMLGATAGVLLHAGLLFPPPDGLAVSGPVLALACAIAFFATVIPTYLLSFALGRVGADGVAMAGYTGPLFTAALGVAILGEAFGPWELAGTALVLAGVWLFNRS